MEFRRIHDLPPYVFATVDQLKRELRRDGRDVIDLGFGNPDIPSPQIAVEKLCEAAAKPTNHRYSASRGLPNLREAVCERYVQVFGVQLDPDEHVVSTIGAKEGLAHLMWVLLEPGDSAVVPSPSYPIHLVAPRLAGATVVHARIEDGDVLSGIEEALEVAEPSPRVVIASFPHNPTTAIATPELMQRLVDLAREHEFILVHDFAYADIAFDGHVPPSVLAGRGRARLRGRALLPDEVLLDGRLADGLHARPARRRRGAREAQVLPRLRHLPADPDRVDRGAARGARLPGRGVRDLPRPPRRALLRASTAPAGTSSPPKGTMFVWAPIPEQYAELGSLEFALKLARDADVAVSPGIGFGPGGDGHVRFALVENEQRITQATRSIRKLLQG